ncbi:TetR/AcrR family transcriptional regulator [Veillonella agrestimuris]|uniref:TetR/AcrR family transcriptional regulator n=1 Tax=Veillonella agrestimuris TaxID=2941340 RepID=UPI002041C2B1|nr:TetR/AcrR family transcriptional regulator [Veillonella agrestimuris]
MKESDNKVAQRYRQMIVDAFLLLTESMPYQEITVLRIVQEADVSRQTFYRHFKTKEDILASIMDRLIREVNHRLHTSSIITLQSALVEYFTFWQHNRNYLRIIYEGQIEAWLLVKYNEAMRDQFCMLSHQFIDLDKREFHLMMSFLIGGLYQLKRDWYERGFKEAPEELAALVANMIRTK